MDFSLSEEQEMFRRAIKDFAQKEVAPLIPEIEEKQLLELPFSQIRNTG